MKRILLAVVLAGLGVAVWASEPRPLPAVTVGDQITVVGERLTLDSKVFNEKRAIFVSLPAGYADNALRYPVIYFTDGSPSRLRLLRGVVDFTAGLNKTPNAILVGIGHVNRDKELTPADPHPDPDNPKSDTSGYGGADQLLNFIRLELIPVVEARYRTLPSRIFVGHSFGGLFGLYALLKQPDLFNAQIAIDPSFSWWNNGSNITDLGTFLASRPTFLYALYVSRSKNMRMGQNFDKLNDLLRDTPNKTFRYGYLALPPTEDHGSAVLPTFYSGLLKLFEEYPKTNLDKMTFEDLKASCGKVIMGTSYPLSEALVNDFGYAMIRGKKFDEAITAFRYNMAAFPKSANPLDSLGEAYEAAGRLNEALASYEKAMELGTAANDANLAVYTAHRNAVKAKLDKS